MQVYAAMIANMDAQIGTLMETLKQTGRDKNTLLVFLTDNGANPAQGFTTNLPRNSGSSSITAMTTSAAKARLSPTAPTGPTSATPLRQLP
jgi:arylsulfatase A-like enzyme